jgi:ankyrin repeat protein
MLMKNGADINARLSKGCRQGSTPLHHAVWGAQVDIIELLIDHGAIINAKSSNKKSLLGSGWTPLHDAVYYGNFRTTKLLIEKGADVNAKTDIVNVETDTGLTPLDFAKREVRLHYLIDFLRNHGAKTGKELDEEKKK